MLLNFLLSKLLINNPVIIDLTHSLGQCRSAIADLMPLWAMQDIAEIEFLEAGYSNSNYRFQYRQRMYVLRIARSRAKPLHVNRSHEKRILTQGVPGVTPDLIAFDETTGNMLSAYIAGKLCVDMAPQPSAVALYLLSLHQSLKPLALEVHRLDDVIFSNLKRSREYGFSVPSWITDQARNLSWTPGHINCHNDLNPWNIICPEPSPESWRTLDWEYAGGNHPLFDAICLSRGLSYQADQERELIQAVAPSCSRADVENAVRAYLLREYSWAALQKASGNQRGVILEQLTNSERNLKQLNTL